MTTMRRPMRSSGVYHSAMPERIWRLFVAEVDFEAEELVGLGDALGDDDLGDAELDLGEVVDGDLRGVGDVRLGGGVGEDAGGVRFGVGWGSGALGGDGVAAADGGTGGGFGEGRGAWGSAGVRGVGWDGGGVGGGLIHKLGGLGVLGLLGSRGGVFHVDHDLGESFVRSGEDGGEGAEFCAGFQAAPF